MSNKAKKIDKYYGMFRSLSITQQIFYFFLFLLAIYTSLLVFLKLDQLNDLLTIHLNKNYYSSVVIAKLNKQREIKTAIDNINILNENNIYDREIMLMNIYTKEMKRNNLTKSNNVFMMNQINNDKSKSMYTNIAQTFQLTKGIKDLINDDRYNILGLYYNFIPLIYQNLVTINNIPLVNFFIIYHDEKCKEEIYFKYPLDSINVDTGGVQSNEHYYDRSLDPISHCSIDDTNNWFYQLSQSNNCDIRIVNVNKENINNEKEEYIFIYYTDSVDTDELSIITKINRKKYGYTFMNSLNDNEVFSMISHKEYSTHINKDNSIYDDIHYFVDDSESNIISTPGFVDDMFSYAMYQKGSSNSSDVLSMRFDTMKNISSNYDVNYYFQNDTLIFTFFDFIHQYYNKGRCSISNLTDYYEKINYNCKVDYCFYNRCNQSNSLFGETFEPWKYDYMPNCLCLPMFCVDDNNKNTIPEEFSEIISLRNMSDDFISAKENFKGEEYYFNYNDKTAKCHINLNIKSSKNIPTKYYLKIKSINRPIDIQSHILQIHFYDDSEIKTDVISPFDTLISNFTWKVYLIYDFGVTVLLLFVIFLFRYKINIIISRVLDIRKLLPKIIEFSNYKSCISNKSLLPQNPANTLSNYNSNDDALSLIDKEPNSKKSFSLSDIAPDIEVDSLEKEKERKTASFHKAFGMIKKGDKYEGERTDELQDLNYLIYSHINEFKLSFSIDENMFGEDKVIHSMYNMLLTDMKRNNSSRVNLSMSIFNEVLSCEGFVDMKKIRPNFYYKESIDNSLLRRINEVDMKGDGVNFINEVTDGEKLKNAIDYYVNVIQRPLKETYDNNN